MPLATVVISSSCVGDSRKPESFLSSSRKSSEFAEYRPLWRHSSSVVMDDNESLEAPILD